MESLIVSDDTFNGVQVAHLQFMETKRGTRLLTSGWWGSARKINYTGTCVL